MDRERFQYVCMESEAGRDAFVTNNKNGQDGIVQSCQLDHVIVKTTDGKDGCWDFHDCTEIEQHMLRG